jgi:Nuclease-related domain
MPVKPRPRRAGGYAQGRYKQGLRNWRSKTRPIFVAIFGPFILAGLAELIIQGHTWSWIAGAATGAFAAAWLVLRDEPPAYVENWHEGEEGERKTAKSLKPLERSGLRVVHDVQTRYGNYDHIAVGRSGVFLLETKNLKGITELRNGVLHLRRRLDPDADTRLDRIRPRALAAAAALKEDIERRTGHRTWVQAVIVFWSEFPAGLVDDGRCTFIHGPRLRAWMESHPDGLDQIAAEEIAAAIADIADDGPSENRAHATQRTALPGAP